MSHNRASCLASIPLLLLILSFLLASFFDTAAGQIGVCYGRIGNNLPHPADVVAFYGQRNIRHMRLYDPDQEVLTALRGSNFELLLDVPNSDLQRIATDYLEADTWVRNNVRNYTEGVKFRYISVGNEVHPSDPAAMFVLPAMQNIENAVSDLGIKVSTTIDTRGFNGYPPSGGIFTSNFRIFIDPVLSFLVSKKSPLLVNIDTYFIYANNMRDELSGGAVKIVVSESGWPTSDHGRLRAWGKGAWAPERATETYLCEQFDTNCEDWISKEARESYRDVFIVGF
uniref:glucan endo-1,3-beta-D-glucosidase n=1 Tax=Brassica campestris TaxID=3711 RepID=M4DDS4_BRACM